ncbi:hypothetical protein N9B44_00055 [bacterium]|nr:hypothetical protein [bacterium]
MSDSNTDAVDEQTDLFSRDSRSVEERELAVVLPDGWASASVEDICFDMRTGLVRSAILQDEHRNTPYVRMGEYS